MNEEFVSFQVGSYTEIFRLLEKYKLTAAVRENPKELALLFTLVQGLTGMERLGVQTILEAAITGNQHLNQLETDTLE